MTWLAQGLKVFPLCKQSSNERIPIYKPNFRINHRNNVVYFHVFVCKFLSTASTSVKLCKTTGRWINALLCFGFVKTFKLRWPFPTAVTQGRCNESTNTPFSPLQGCFSNCLVAYARYKYTVHSCLVLLPTHINLESR